MRPGTSGGDYGGDGWVVVGERRWFELDLESQLHGEIAQGHADDKIDLCALESSSGAARGSRLTKPVLLTG
jgi:hypothetical protein